MAGEKLRGASCVEFENGVFGHSELFQRSIEVKRDRLLLLALLGSTSVRQLPVKHTTPEHLCSDLELLAKDL